MDEFESTRRQRFLSKQYYDWLLPQLTDEIEYWSSHESPNGSTEIERKALAARLRSSYVHRRFLLRFTAGSSLAMLRDELPLVVESLEQYTALRRASLKDNGYPPLMFGEIDEYERAMQLISLCHLLHRTELLQRIADMLDPFYRAQDTLYEDLLAYGLDGRFDVDKWFHDKPYKHLINSMYRDSQEESVVDIEAYLDAWYPAMKMAPWHDSHIKANEHEGGAYVGYWAIEAAAATYLLELDDTSFRNHLLYPKDLTDFARAFEVRQQPQSAEAGAGPLTVRTGQICPETGIWNAAGHNVPGVMVRQGEVMPDVYVPDARGTLKPAPATWAFERKA
ncbi:PoNe immunity protein domain-containing protein [Burkholderia sp. 9120]|uniref:PoNe immunity protein domain-containing protein n=1 Tax=Burkholderia sp. 9120 TaxID=1500897 RepID=UPI0005530D54|nr:PoNe immunity protein domain-containing protein [Burkholderia sp. 9120]